MIAGDFDSIEESVHRFYEKKFPDFEVEFRQDSDQNTTDFDKAIDVVKDHESVIDVPPPSSSFVFN